MMRTLISCKYHEDSQTVELLYTDGTLIDIDCMAVEDEVARNMYERSELDYLLTHDPVGYSRTSREERYSHAETVLPGVCRSVKELAY